MILGNTAALCLSVCLSGVFVTLSLSFGFGLSVSVSLSLSLSLSLTLSLSISDKRYKAVFQNVEYLQCYANGQTLTLRSVCQCYNE